MHCEQLWTNWLDSQLPPVILEFDPPKSKPSIFFFLLPSNLLNKNKNLYLDEDRTRNLEHKITGLQPLSYTTTWLEASGVKII